LSAGRSRCGEGDGMRGLQCRRAGRTDGMAAGRVGGRRHRRIAWQHGRRTDRWAGGRPGGEAADVIAG